MRPSHRLKRQKKQERLEYLKKLEGTNELLVRCLSALIEREGNENDDTFITREEFARARDLGWHISEDGVLLALGDGPKTKEGSDG